MTRKTTFYCDCCGKSSDPGKAVIPDGWFIISITRSNPHDYWELLGCSECVPTTNAGALVQAAAPLRLLFKKMRLVRVVRVPVLFRIAIIGCVIGSMSLINLLLSPSHWLVAPTVGFGLLGVSALGYVFRRKDDNK